MFTVHKLIRATVLHVTPALSAYLGVLKCQPKKSGRAPPPTLVNFGGGILVMACSLDTLRFVNETLSPSGVLQFYECWQSSLYHQL